jgi:hypothetical protein
MASAQKAEHREVVRARVVCDAIAGLPNEENARHNGVRPDTVRKYRKRAAAAANSEEAFGDLPRCGRPRSIAVATRATLVQIACSRPEPELERGRVRARVRAARLARREAKAARKIAIAAEKRAFRQERAAQDRACVEAARRQRREARCASRKAERALFQADEALHAALADTTRATIHPSSFSSVWSYPALQTELKRVANQEMSVSEIRRTLQCGGLRPHRVRIWLHSPDPDFAVKARAICDLYLNPPPGVVLCVDEKTGIQARDYVHPVHICGGTGCARCEFEYRRNGTSTLIAGFDIRSGEVFGRCWRRDANGIVRYLEEVAERYPSGDVTIVWDNLNVHKHEPIEAFNARHPRFRFVYTPFTPHG